MKNQPLLPLPLLAALALLALQAPALAQAPAPDNKACQTRNRSEQVAVVICPPGATQEALKAAGVAACKGAKGQCNAWIWDKPEKAPMKAPAADTDMPKATAGSARAVWMNDSQNLMELRKAP